MRIAVFTIINISSVQSVFTERRGLSTFQLHNDLFANTDKDYANGARLFCITDDREESDFTDMETWLASVQRRAPDLITGFHSPEAPVYNYGISLTQLIFTPNDFNASEAPPGEHPYVGWLALGFFLHAKDSNAINSFELSLGLSWKRCTSP